MALNKFLRQGEKVWVHHSGRTFLIDQTREAATAARAKSKASHGILESPMPGKVLKVNVKVGERVKENQTLCVIEAMKMEYALKAPFSGKVKNIYKSAGQIVVLAEKILEIETS